jgi:Uma2 family endonuclease
MESSGGTFARMTGMETKALVSLEEYKRTSFEGLDREYLGGEIVERTLPTYRHGKTQSRLAALIARFQETHPLFAATETRLLLGEGRVRIPDISVFASEEPTEEIPSRPPLIVIEIVSPDDRHIDVLEKLEEYHAWGVPNVWLVDPYRQRCYIYAAGLREVSTLEVPEFGVRIGAAEIF